MKKVLSLFVCVFTIPILFAQQEVMVSQYMFNGLFLNPAYAGSHELYQATALHRSQWVKFDKSPKTQILGLDGAFAQNTVGAGLILIHDELGDTKQFEIIANGAYHLDLDSEGKNRLSFGLKMGVSNYSSNLSDTRVENPNDPVFAANISNEWVSKFGFGLYFYNPTAYAGLSIPTFYSGDDNLNIVSDSVKFDTKYFEQHFFLNMGKVFTLNENLKVKPSLLIKYHEAAPLEVDINCNFLIKETVWLGASYRTGDAVVGILEYNIDNAWRIGYSYDFTLTDIADYSSGSHEIMLGYQFGPEVIKTRSPRYF